MTWQFPAKPYALYSRNPLDSVVVQLRFQPILKIGQGKGIADFQEIVRTTFPEYAEGAVRDIAIGPEGQFDLHESKAFEFSISAENRKVRLTSDNFLIESKRHLSRDVLLSDLQIVADAMKSVYAPVVCTRLGVRYINVIDPERISRDLGRTVGWRDLVKPDYLEMPADIVDLTDTQFSSQISSSLLPGMMTVRYGLSLPGNQSTGGLRFTFDIDRFTETDLQIERIGADVRNFTEDIFSIFHTVVTDELMEWMLADEE